MCHSGERSPDISTSDASPERRPLSARRGDGDIDADVDGDGSPVTLCGGRCWPVVAAAVVRM